MQESKPFNHTRVKDRNLDELIGITKGLIADNEINTKEATFLLNWIETNFNKNDLYTYPADIIYDRLLVMLKDNTLDEQEAKELLELLQSITGGKPIAEQVTSMTTTLPLDNPAPEVIFTDNTFCLTGTFTIGTRKAVEDIIKEKGGKVTRKPTKTTNYLVIGLISSKDWIHSTHGRKIEQALQMQERDLPIKIISEEHLIKFL